MKKLYFLVVFIVSIATQAQIVNIPDSNFKARLVSSTALNLRAKDLSGNFFAIDANADGEIQVSEAQQVSYIKLSESSGTSVYSLEGINEFSNITYFSTTNSNLYEVNFSSLQYLETINITYSGLDIINLTNLPSLKILSIWYNSLTQLDLNNVPNLELLNCYNNNLTNLDLSMLSKLNSLTCYGNFLVFLNIKNGLNQVIQNNLAQGYVGNPTLKYICLDDSELNYIQNLISPMEGGSDVVINGYCSFVPGGEYFTINGNTKFDNNSNSCDVNDINYTNLNFSITDGTNSGLLISNTSGNYSIPVQAGSHTITPVLENPTYFNISPTSFVADFPTQTSPLNQDFCVTANGVHHDLESVIIPTNPARPGFNANYTIIYKNKGNQIENGTVSLTYYEDNVLDLVSTNPLFNSQAGNTLVWNYTNLQPFETRTIDLVFNVNSPMETPAVNIGDQLNYTATITPMITDEYQFDNSSTLKQIVVGSYDPNDKTCIEGTTVGPDMIGQYVHYVIRFENTGTYAAENVVVKDMIDLTKFDVNTLIPLHSSHDFVTRIAGNKVEFIFEGINLPFDDANNDGYITFKIKTKPNLVVGDTFSNNASIYFDYNFPIITNTYTTTIAALSTTDFDFGTHFTLYPNPVKEILNFQSKDNTTINSIEIYNALGQIVLAIPNVISSVDVSNLQTGSYFIKVNTDLGVSNTKFIKE